MDIEEHWQKVKISQIKKIDLSHNKLQKVDIFIGQEHISIFEDFLNLEELYLSDNPIEEIHPKSFKNLKKLKIFEMNNSFLSKLHHFRFLKNMNSLEKITLKRHQCFDMSIREFISTVGQLENLRELDISQENNEKTKFNRNVCFLLK